MNIHDLIDSFEKNSPSLAQEQKMLKIILDNGTGGIVSVKRTTKRFALIAAVIAVCVLTATTALAISLGWNEKLIEYLKPSEKQMETLSGAVGTPEATLTKNGVTITVKQTLADSYGIYVLYEMTVPENITLNDNIKWSLEVLDITTDKSDVPYGCGTISSEILDQIGNKRTVLLHIQETNPFKNGYAKLILRDLDYITKNPKIGAVESTPVADGEWTLKWDFNYVDTSKIIEVNMPLNINGSEDTITKIVISPMSFCAYVTGDDILGSARPIINFNNGSQLTYDDVGLENMAFCYYLIDEAKMIYNNQLYYRFKNIINLEDIENITIGDVTIPIR